MGKEERRERGGREMSCFCGWKLFCCCGGGVLW